MSRYLITGGEGFIGSKIVSEINGVSFDIKSGLDILNEEQLMHAVGGIEGIFHCAAKISVPESVALPKEYHRINVEGTDCVIKAAESERLKIVFSSSAAVYGGKGDAVSEESALNPKSPYAQNKVDAEDALKKSSVPHIALRYFNVYGPGQSAQYAGVITAFIRNALRGDDLIIYGDGNQIRDFVFVNDVVRANVMAMAYRPLAFEFFNIASGIETPIKTLAETIVRLTDSKSKIVYEAPRPGDIVYSRADVSKAKKTLGWEATTTLEEGLSETISYYKKELLA